MTLPRALAPAPFAALALSLAAAVPLFPAAAAPQDAAALRSRFLDGSLDGEPRAKAGLALLAKDPEALGTAIAELAKKKDPGNLGALVPLGCRIAPRHLRCLAVAAARDSDAAGAMAAFLERTAATDLAERIRAVEAVGLLLPGSKDKAAQAKLVEIARTGAPLAAIEAIRGLSRPRDARLEKEFLEMCASVADNHVRKHAVWAVLDLSGERVAEKKIEMMAKRPGDAGRMAKEAVEILKDKEEKPFEWDPQPLKRIAEWWAAGRGAPGKSEVSIGDVEMKGKVGTFVAELRTTAPGWGHLVECAFSTITLGAPGEPMVDMKVRALRVRASEVNQCGNAWQGAYVLSRDALIGLQAVLGEPFEDHRGWEPAYVDIHAFQVETKRSPGTLPEFVNEIVGRKPWR
jgi:hypothetical protein